jgi:hypothetical protein
MRFCAWLAISFGSRIPKVLLRDGIAQGPGSLAHLFTGFAAEVLLFGLGPVWHGGSVAEPPWNSPPPLTGSRLPSPPPTVVFLNNPRLKTESTARLPDRSAATRPRWDYTYNPRPPLTGSRPARNRGIKGWRRTPSRHPWSQNRFVASDRNRPCAGHVAKPRGKHDPGSSPLLKRPNTSDL